MAGQRHITVPSGFRAAGVACGIKPSGRRDLAIIAADQVASAGILTTRNQVIGAPIRYCRSILPKGSGRIRAIVINAGNANACTGARGERDARAMAAQAAKYLNIPPEQVLVASTGIIGEALPMDNVRRGIADAAGRLSRSSDAAALQAIMTTDTREKSAVLRRRVGGRKITLAGMIKGSGMIAPSVGTLIAVLTTDAPATPAACSRALRQARRTTFNAITVDGDTSPSDMVVLLASGSAGGKEIGTRSRSFAGFSSAVEELCSRLVRQVVADGEGASKVIQVTVRRARSEADAEAAAKTVANSPLVKCAIGGADPNLGRIVAALGKSPARVAPDRLTVRVGPLGVFARGSVLLFDRARLRRHLQGREVAVLCDLGLGKGAFTALTCDLTSEYVRINTQYHT